MRRPPRSKCSAVAALLLSIPAAVSAAPVVLARTDRFALRSKATGFEYDIRIALPRSFAGSQKQYPVVVLLDADYSFPAAHAVINHLTDRGRLPEMVVVGVGYADADDRDAYRRHRTRDYTPWFAPDGGYGPEFQKLSGGGPAFARFLGEELLPALAARYRTTDDRTLVGHSYGGLFAAWMLSKGSRDFRRFIIVSPSLWYLDRRLLRENEARKALPAARAYLSVGQNENPEMESDLRRFHQLLGAGPDLAIEVWSRQNHDTVFPFALSNGLRFLWTKEGWGSEARATPPAALGR